MWTDIIMMFRVCKYNIIIDDYFNCIYVYFFGWASKKLKLKETVVISYLGTLQIRTKQKIDKNCDTYCNII